MQQRRAGTSTCVHLILVIIVLTLESCFPVSHVQEAKQAVMENPANLVENGSFEKAAKVMQNHGRKEKVSPVVLTKHMMASGH